MWLAAVILIIVATTWPWTDFKGHSHWAKVEWLPFSQRFVPADLMLNVLLFVPMGLSGRRAWPSVPGWLWVLAAFTLSLSVETYQLYSHSRFPTTVDLLTNTVGAWVGVRASRRLPLVRPGHGLAADPTARRGA